MRIYHYLVVSLAIMALSGCVSSRSVRYELTDRTSKPKNYPIEIFESKDLHRPYKVIGLVQAEARRRHNIEDQIEHLRIKAREMGADALVGLQHVPIGVGVPSQGGTIYSGHSRDLWTAKAIVWVSE